MKKTITVDITDEDMKIIDEIRKRENRNLKNTVETIIKDWLKKERKEQAKQTSLFNTDQLTNII